VRVLADGQTDTLTDANRFYNVPRMLYDIAMGQIKNKTRQEKRRAKQT